MKRKRIRDFGFMAAAFVWMVLFPASAAASANDAGIPDTGSLTIHKYALQDMADTGLPGNGNETEDIPEEAVPAAGIEFTIWQVDTTGDFIPENASQAQEHLLESTVQSGKTDADGNLVFAQLPKGIYYVEETGEALSYIPCKPFLVSVPMTNPDGNGWIRDVHVYPKNQFLQIDKFVGDAGNADYDFNDRNAAKHKPVAGNETFGWSILSSIPANLGKTEGEAYTITDALSANFAYVPGSVKVYSVSEIDMPCQEGNLLNEGSEYILTFHEATNTLTVTLTAEGMSLLSQRYADRSAADRFLLIKYDCGLTEQAVQGISLYSGATVSYTMAAGPAASGTSTGKNTFGAAVRMLLESSEKTAVQLAVTRVTVSGKVAEEPEVHTGQVGITKLEDGTDRPLAGASFGIAASKEDAVNGTFLATGTTDANGLLTFTGLSYGIAGDLPSENTGDTSYWIMEQKAPEGYQELTEPAEVVFNYHQEKKSGEYYFARVTVYNAAKEMASPTPAPSGVPGSSGAKPATIGSSGAKTAKTGDDSAMYLFFVLLLASSAGIAAVWVKNRRKNSV